MIETHSVLLYKHSILGTIYTDHNAAPYDQLYTNHGLFSGRTEQRTIQYFDQIQWGIVRVGIDKRRAHGWYIQINTHSLTSSVPERPHFHTIKMIE